MTETKQLLERARHQFPPPGDVMDVLVRRRDGRRRSRRIVAGAVAVAVFVASIWAVTRGDVVDRAPSPAEPGDTLPDPEPDSGPRGIELVVPPAGAEPSAPAHGTLVLSYVGRPAVLSPDTGMSGEPLYRLFVYEDGRVLWDHVESDSQLPLATSGYSTGLIEQRLTPEGLRLLLDEVRSSGLLDGTLRLISGESFHWGSIRFFGDDGPRRLFVSTSLTISWLSGDAAARYEDATPEQAGALELLTARLADLDGWLPDGAWADPVPRAYVASRYSVCVHVADPTSPPSQDHLLPPPVDPAEIVALLPQEAQAILAKDRVRDAAGCYVLPLDRARTLSEMLALELDRWKPTTQISYVFEMPARFGWPMAFVNFGAITPHGEGIGFDSG
jgi:hypothetical protein